MLDAAAAPLAAWALPRLTGGCWLATQSRESTHTSPGVDAAAPITSYRLRAEDLLQRRAARARVGECPLHFPCSRTARDGQTLRADRRAPGVGDRRASAANAQEQLHSGSATDFLELRAVPGHQATARAALTAWEAGHNNRVTFKMPRSAAH